jgi:predicted esterase
MSANENERLDEAMRRADELLVGSLKTAERRRWRTRLLWCGAAVLLLGVAVAAVVLITSSAQRRQETSRQMTTPAAGDPKLAQAYEGAVKDYTHSATTSTTTSDWPARLAELNDEENWRKAFATGSELARLAPDQSYKILSENWQKIPTVNGRQQVLKAFVFADHPRVLDILHLAMTDPSPQVRGWGVNYLRDIALVDFGEDSSAYDKWRAAIVASGKTKDQLLVQSTIAWVDRLKQAQGKELQKEARLTQDATRALSKSAAARKAAIEAGALDVALSWLRGYSKDQDIVRGAEYILRALEPDEKFLRENLLPMTRPDQPAGLRNAALEILGRKGNDWAIDPLLELLASSIKDKKQKRFASEIAQALGEIGNPRVIPTMIAVIAADNTYDTIYGVGYFGLRDITGVRYDESHDGAWWKQWWERERARYPEPARSMPVPTLTHSTEASSQLDPSFAQFSRVAEARGVTAPIFAMMLAGGDPPVQELRANENEKMQCFLVGPKTDKAPAAGYKLLLVLPGGDGSAEFRPFLTNIAANSLSDDYLLVQLVAPTWRAKPQITWPTAKVREPGMKFTTEEFIDAVVAEVKSKHKVDEKHVYALGWSSGGPAVYAAALREKTPLTGAFVAMSVFKPLDYGPAKTAAGKAFYILHSPTDFIPMRFPQSAKQALGKSGAKVELQEYEGGHGWHGDIFAMITKGVEWLEKQPKTKPSPATTRVSQ